MSKFLVSLSYIDPKDKTRTPRYIDVYGPFERVIIKPDEVVAYRVWQQLLNATRVGQVLAYRPPALPDRWRDASGALFTHIDVFPEEEAKVIAPKSRRRTVIMEKPWST